LKDVFVSLAYLLFVISMVIAFLALAGWLIAVCVEAVFGIDFTFWQGAALLILSRLLLTRINIVTTNENNAKESE